LELISAVEYAYSTEARFRNQRLFDADIFARRTPYSGIVLHRTSVSLSVPCRSRRT